MTSAELVDRLIGHKTLGAAPREELEWLAAHGTFRQLPAGQTVAAVGHPLLEMYVILQGHIAIFVDRGGGRHKVTEWRTGEVTGTLPYSRMVTPPGNSMTQEPTEVLAVSRDEFPALIRECHQITSILVHKMLDRARVADRRREVEDHLAHRETPECRRLQQVGLDPGNTLGQPRPGGVRGFRAARSAGGRLA